MSILIKGMEMPKGCTYCPFADDDASYCNAANEYIPMVWRSKFCPMIEVPTPHGRLIDADAFDRHMKQTPRYFSMCFDLEEQPTIIEAEEGVKHEDQGR